MRASVTQIKTFKACRRAWDLRYREHLKPVQRAEALEIGSSYHAFVEELEKTGTIAEPDYSMPCAMAFAHKKYLLDGAGYKVVEAEVKLERQVGRHTLFGVVDGLTSDNCILEHKTTSMDISPGGEYEYNLQWDDQIRAYMLLTGVRKVHYTVIRKPTIRRKGDETEEDFFNRMVAWYDVDTEHKIRRFTVECTAVEVIEFEEQFKAICDEMQRGVIYRNSCHCTAWGRRCEYAGICLNYDPSQQYIGYVRQEEEML